jgi:hypothetical protein
LRQTDELRTGGDSGDVSLVPLLSNLIYTIQTNLSSSFERHSMASPTT